jgi:hypothetical protein
MRRLFLVFSVLGLLAASGLEARGYKDSWKFEGLIGPNIDMKDWGGHQFGMDLKLGKGDILSGLLGFAFGGLNSAQIKLGLAIDIPFYFTFSKPNDFAMGPSFDVGPRFGFGGAAGTGIDFLNIGFGLRTAYKISNSFGVVANLIHFSTSFVAWNSNAGVNSNFAMAYDMRFGVFYLF